MDCCNYMQYRHHQYYGSQYYEPIHQYNGDYYGQQVYQEYYDSYYQQWPCTSSFPDYVYNPKEARIRKAMRDATRERSIGTSPMLSRPNARRPSSSHSWMQTQPHDDLIMPPMASIQTPAVCSYPIASSAGDQQFLGGMNSFNKLETTSPPTTSSVHTNYMQANPLAQLQQHAEMWPDYQSLRPRSSGNPFMIGDVASYSSQNTEMNTSIIIEKEPTPSTSSATNDAESNKEQETYLQIFEQDEKIKKTTTLSQLHVATKKSTTKPLPDFNEAFGSTERGRFQSPPDPRLAPNKSYIDYFFDSTPIKFDDYQI